MRRVVTPSSADGPRARPRPPRSRPRRRCHNTARWYKRSALSRRRPRAPAPWPRSRLRWPPRRPSCRRCRSPWPGAARCTNFRVGGLGAIADYARQIRDRREGLRALAGKRIVEAALLAGVARQTGGVDEHHESVPVAIEADGAHGLGVAAGGALVPQLLAGAAPEPRLALVDGPPQRLPFIQARVNTLPVVASWTTAGTSPSSPNLTRARPAAAGVTGARPGPSPRA